MTMKWKSGKPWDTAKCKSNNGYDNSLHLWREHQVPAGVNEVMYVKYS